MQNANTMRDILSREFAENYIEKLFYFCLKKTGNNAEAEDLTQDIALQVITALNRGTVPSSFSAWVWKIARNRYSVWAKAKHRKNESVTCSDVGEHDIPDESGSILDEMIFAEQISMLRRELAFIKSDYRNIIVAYYLENKSVRDIASSLSLSTSAVQQRLHRARIILKEGIDMAREFGIRSYKPEEIMFFNSCSSLGEYGQPWSILKHRMYTNIFLEAYGNPSTAEELSIELGIALPYMEDELKYLTEQTFLIKRENKYETSFPIIDKDVQEKIWGYNTYITAKLTSLLEKLVDCYAEANEAHGINFYGKYVTYEDAKWVLLMMAFDQLSDVDYKENFEYAKRPNNGNWDIVGFQNSSVPFTPPVGLHNSKKGFFQYRYEYENIYTNTPAYLSGEETKTLRAVAEGKASDCDKPILEKLEEYGYIRKSCGTYEPAIVVLDERRNEESLLSFTETERDLIKQTADEIKNIIGTANEFAFRLTAESLPPLFKNDDRMCYFACRNSTMNRGVVLMQAIKDGYIKYDEHTGKAVGAYIYI